MMKNILLWVVLLLPYLGLLWVWKYHKNEIAKIDKATLIVISKEEMTLALYDYKGKMLAEYPVAVGRNFGDKQIKGDMRTPEGVFTVSQIQNSAHWTYNFGDGKGEIQGAYGPNFIRLLTPGHQGIGIHGTHDDNSIGTRSSEGCIRLNNKNLEELVKNVGVGNVVIITPSKQDLVAVSD